MLLLLASGCTENRRDRAHKLILEIESYQAQNHKIPDNITETSMKDEYSIFYIKRDSDTYIIGYGAELGESYIYNSDSKEWTHGDHIAN